MWVYQRTNMCAYELIWYARRKNRVKKRKLMAHFEFLHLQTIDSICEIIYYHQAVGSQTNNIYKSMYM